MGYKTYTCPIARDCGGCEWLAVPYPIQLRRKQEQVEGLLGEMAAADGCELEPIRGMDEPLRYRHKAATPFAHGARGRVLCGFYAAGTHRIVPCRDCLVEDPRARRILGAVAQTAERLHIPPYDEDRGVGVLRHAVVRCGYATDDVLLTLVTRVDELRGAERLVSELRAACPEVTSIVQNLNDRRTNAILGRRCHTLYGPGHMHDRLLGCTFEIGPTSFYQTNPAQTEVLYRLALEGAAGARRVLDAYCGTGTIGICAAAESPDAQVVGVEQVTGAVACARRNAEANGVAQRCRFVAADATAWMAGAGREERFDVVVMDPPRAGSTPEFLAGVAALAPGRVVYVSCNVITQARDLELLRERGYRLTRVAPVDMFPHTKHVETVVLLGREFEKSREHVYLDYKPSKEIDLPGGATYSEIKQWIQAEYGLKVSSLYVAQVKQKHGIVERECYNKPKSENAKQPKCPPEKEAAIEAALKHFKMI
ncbi:23S rRNA (uracil(1939)-C(5))-methyltransferase RlmD [Thermophilibacter sp. ET337]|uniref:23S rRNA (uracil(1939)-C(5))-methyltransferase RlmD n=1 Tax=Thermophilibacter sp. ET337 TaxID=2973084 RepID=UPI0021ACBBFC|nr:23S rRNA (uracil(1939)-C(5))-methyltransferase RlmD [Thermophilibacter sp. ET337]MCR8908344.1 23S rRNA (uracil(1939)-C(5))-methyltransferase RlmD [Thermophilibacter sp. ET337]